MSEDRSIRDIIGGYDGRKPEPPYATNQDELVRAHDEGYEQGRLVERLREMAEHGGAPSRLATMRAAADALTSLCERVEALERERDDLADLILAYAMIEMAPALISAARMYAKGQPCP